MTTAPQPDQTPDMAETVVEPPKLSVVKETPRPKPEVQAADMAERLQAGLEGFGERITEALGEGPARFVVRIRGGLLALPRFLIRWVKSSESSSIRWQRIFVVFVALYAVPFSYVISPRSTILIVIVAFIGTAWYETRDVVPAEDEEEPDEEEPDEEEPDEEEAPRAPVRTQEEKRTEIIEWIRERIGDDTGIHLKTLLLLAKADGKTHDANMTRDELRERLHQLGIKTNPKVKPRSNPSPTRGVWLRDLPPSPREEDDSDGALL